MKRSWRADPTLVVGLLAIAVVLAACGSAAPAIATKTCPTPVAVAAPEQIPGAIREAADRIVISRVGKAFFGRYACFEPGVSGYNPGEPMCIEDPANCAAFVSKPHYMMVYSFQVPNLSGTLGAEFALDATGSLITEREVFGLPDCVHYPQECVFKVTDEAAAIAIAEKAGLEPGVEEWRTSFHWFGGELRTQVWTVESTLIREQTGQASGRTVVIDANSGEVLQISGWVATP